MSWNSKVSLTRNPEVMLPEDRVRTADALIAAGAVLAIIFLAYLPANLEEFGGSGDDYTAIQWNLSGHVHLLSDTLIGAGRPFAGPISALIFSFVESVPDLRWARFISTTAIGLSGALLAILVIRISSLTARGRTLLLAVIAGVVGATTTASPVISTSAIMSGVALALPIALTGGIFATFNESRYFPKQMWVASTLIFIAAFTYQAYVLVAVLPPALWAAHSWVTRRSVSVVRIGIVLLLIPMSLIANFAFLRLQNSWALNRLSGGTFQERLNWFAQEVVPRTVDITIPTETPTTLLSVGLIAIATAACAAAGWRFLALPASVLSCWAFATLALYPGEMHASYRVVASSQLILWGGMAVSIALAALSVSQMRWRFFILTGFLTLFSFTSLVAGSQRASMLIAMPNSVTWSSAQCAVKDLANGKASTVATASGIMSRSPVVSYEYGSVAGKALGVLSYLIWLALESNNSNALSPDFTPNDISVVGVESGQLDPAVIVISEDICGTLPEMESMRTKW